MGVQFAHLASRLLWALALVTGLLGASGCSEIFGGDSASGTTNRGVGEDCDSSADCRSGLVCTQRVCSVVSDGPAGSVCTLTGECEQGLYCQPIVRADGSFAGICAEAGSAVEDEPCGSTADCQRGLYCQLFGLSGTCRSAGSGDVGSGCALTSDCLAGLTCGPQQTCLQSAVPAGAVVYDGAECPSTGTEAEDFRVLFEVPRSGQPVEEFYAMPFPNDIRVRNGRVDLRGHPHPELDVVGNVLKRFIDLIEQDVTGFGPHQTVFFRFSRFPDGDSIELRGEDPVLSFVNIDSDSPEYGRRRSLGWSGTDAPGRFICRNWIGVRPFWTEPFREGTTYAAIITDGIRSLSGDEPVQPPDLAAVLDGTEPDDSDLAAAWRAYAPLRNYLADQGIARSSIAGAAVFTIGEPTRNVPAIRDAIEALGAPDHGDLVLCDSQVTSPCDDGLEGEAHERGCFAASADFWEIHTTVEIPVFQEGDAPYYETGGAFLYDEAGAPILQRTEEVCTSLTIPRDGDMPESGWPVVVYAHGTGGNFRDQAASLGADLSGIGYATIGFDGVQHGTRRGGSTLDPEVLFFNYANPRGVLGSVLQGAVDVMAFGRFAANLGLTAGQSPTGEAIELDPTRVVFFGHSQGAIVGPPALAVDDVYVAAILSGGGGGLMLSLLNKTSPVNIAGGVQAILQEGALNENHPILNLIQLYFEPADTINFGPGIVYERPEEMTSHHLFMTYGLGDTFTPNITTKQLAHVVGLPVLTPVVDDTIERPEVTPPVTGNIVVGGGEYTAAVGQYEPPLGRDGHFVVFDVAAARTQLLGFLESLATDGIPTIPAP